MDAGFAAFEGVAAFLAAGLGRPVIGSESQSDAGLVARLGDRAVLSLDTRGPSVSARRRCTTILRSGRPT